MHGNKSQGQRQRALAQFERGQVETLVATDVAARGIDVEDITHVINFDAPVDSDTYVHRTGRTGRAGRPGAGVTFVIPDERREMRAIARRLDLGGELDGSAAGSRPRHGGRTRRRRQRS
jgi:ATP-dependent RNA helicase RhlE